MTNASIASVKLNRAADLWDVRGMSTPTPVAIINWSKSIGLIAANQVPHSPPVPKTKLAQRNVSVPTCNATPQNVRVVAHRPVKITLAFTMVDQQAVRKRLPSATGIKWLLAITPVKLAVLEIVRHNKSVKKLQSCYSCSFSLTSLPSSYQTKTLPIKSLTRCTTSTGKHWLRQTGNRMTYGKF